MDFELTEDQQAIVQLAAGLMGKHGGPARARAVLAGGGYDYELERALRDAGLCELAADQQAGALEAALVVEAVAAGLGVVDIGTRNLVLPAVNVAAADGPTGLAVGTNPQRVRFGAQASRVLAVDGGGALVAKVARSHDESRDFGVPVATVELSAAEALPPGAGGRLLRWWRVANSLEVAGIAGAALDLTVDYLKQRHQFGRAIGGLQAVQHRLSTLYVSLEGTRWLSRYAAYHGDDGEAAAVAATCAAKLAHDAIWELHQLSGAIGFTKEYDLHLFTMRLHGLRLELAASSGSHARAVAAARWG